MANGINIDTAGLGNLISGVGSAAKDIRAAITGKAIIDPAAESALQEKLADIEAQVMNAQATINAAEATNPNMFIAGWRPFLGWVCGIALAYSFIIIPWGTALVRIWVPSFTMPSLDTNALFALVTSMLGVGTMRSFEKIKGAEGNR